MEKEGFGTPPLAPEVSPPLRTIASLVEEATTFLQNREDYRENTSRYIILTWRQFREYCDANGYEMYSLECKRGFMQSLSDHIPPFSANTLQHKESYLRMLDLYGRNGTWEKGELNPKSELMEEFASYIVSEEEFLRKRHYSEHTISTYRKQADTFLRFFQERGLRRLSDLNSNHISAYVVSLKGHARSTIRGELSQIRQMLHNAYLLEYTQEDLSAYVPTYSLGHAQSNVKIWESAELDKVLETVDRSNPKGLRDAAYITIASELGMRSKDITDLKLTDIDWEACSLSYTQSKTGKVNQLPINEKTGRAIIEYLKVRPETDCEYLFVKMAPPYGKMNAFYSSFCRYVSRSGVTVPTNAHHNLHSLRATVATRLLEEGISPDDIFSFLGHSDRQSLSNYIRMDIENLRGCALSFEDGEFV